MKKIYTILIVVMLGMVSFKFTQAQTSINVDDLIVMVDQNPIKPVSQTGMPEIKAETENKFSPNGDSIGVSTITKIIFFGTIDSAYVFIAFNKQYESIKNTSFELEKPLHLSFAAFNKNATEMCKKIKDLLNTGQAPNHIKVTDVNLMYLNSDQSLSTVLVSFVKK